MCRGELSNLHRLSIITLTWDEYGARSGSVRARALVQRVPRERAGPAACTAEARAGAVALLETRPQRDHQPEHALPAQRLPDNSDALAATVPGPLWTPDLHPLLFRAGRSRTEGGLLGQVQGRHRRGVRRGRSERFTAPGRRRSRLPLPRGR
jgi:hypothetical protein